MLRFLITDDDDVTHAYLRHVLIGLGDVRHCFSGREALDACKEALSDGAPFDCVLMDVLMPGLNGLETMDMMRTMHSDAARPDPKFVIISCLTEMECRFEAKAPCEADRYIAKPFDRRTVLTALAGLGFGQPPGAEEVEETW
jgi:two-component system chemotaxis response regulator CheY